MNRARRITQQIKVEEVPAVLKPCPFCGGKPVMKRGGFFHVICEACNIDFIAYGAEVDKIQTAARWNSRCGKETE